eukprot:CAMPEP_0113938872 /NCGR_PEP_ID=MMETSP1339-20121228/5290_1 /TAXON_ID=94617 /ORGANISM="Fibrocapsa japonica" /LENGTH=213 /DNA_ID=CAMNT_0000942187 /DNA_START=143 /DNA_END=784 /DNA_ORIENTATION=- /assembly_acc=CAM_ASM_000762
MVPSFFPRAAGFVAILIIIGVANPVQSFVNNPTFGVRKAVHFTHGSQGLASSVLRASVLDTNVPTIKETDSPGVLKLANMQEYLDAIANAGDKLVVVKFFATWCRSCKQLDYQYKKLPAQHPDVMFCEIAMLDEENNNKAFFKQYEVEVLPTVFFFRGAAGMIDRMPCGMKRIPIFKEKIDTYKKMDAPVAAIGHHEEVLDSLYKNYANEAIE